MDNIVTRKQHYIAQGVMSKFKITDKTVTKRNKQVWYFDKEIKSLSVKSTSEIMYEDYFYETSYYPENYLEKEFGKIETHFLKKISKIIKMLDNNCKFCDLKPLIEELLPFYLQFYFKSKAYLYYYSQKFDLNYKNDEIKKDNCIGNLMSILNDSTYIKDMVTNIKRYYKIAILKDETESFILCDRFIAKATTLNINPFHLYAGSKIGSANIVLLLPISSKYYIILFDDLTNIDRNKINTIELSERNKINGIIKENAFQFAVGNKKEIFESKDVECKGITNGKSIFNTFFRKEINDDYENNTIVVISEPIVYYYNKDFYNIIHKIDTSKLDKIEEAIKTVTKFIEENKRKVNDVCFCDSGKKYKRCCKKDIEYFIKETEKLKYIFIPAKTPYFYSKNGVEKPIVVKGNLKDIKYYEWGCSTMGNDMNSIKTENAIIEIENILKKVNEKEMGD